MQLHPTRPTIHVALCGALLLVVGVVLRRAELAAFGAALVLTVAAFRTAAESSVARMRGAGFEMVWRDDSRVLRLRRGETRRIVGEIRNRGTVEARAVHLRLLASGSLEAELSPQTLDLAGGSRVALELTVTAPRVGRFGIHGLTLDVRGIPVGGDALYEVPLMFANPLGIEVVPATSRHAPARSMASAGSGRRASSRRLGHGDELRELRDHVPGDSFKRIAWKTSARRGKLTVRETDDERNAVVWVVLDASSEHWSGGLGRSLLDAAIDRAASVAYGALARGEAVGFAVVAGGLRARLRPGHGEAQRRRIEEVLLGVGSFHDVSRSEVELEDLAARVAEHLRPLDGGQWSLQPTLDGLLDRVRAARPRAPFDRPSPEARSADESLLRKHLADFGIELPARSDGERARSETALELVLASLEREPRGEVHVLVAPLVLGASRRRVFARLRRGRTRVVVHLYDVSALVAPAHGAFEGSVRRALALRSSEAYGRCRRELGALGVVVRSCEPR